jgi:flagellar assembly protein FliH
MRSSREVQPWQLSELGQVGQVPPPAAAVRTPPVFEVAPQAGVPDQLLAPSRAAAQAAGYAAGWASGLRAAKLVADAEAHVAAAARDRAVATQRAALEQAVTALATAASGLERRALPAAQDIEELIVSAAFAIAESLVGSALRDELNRSRSAVARALQLAPTDEDVTVALSPADLAVLGGPAAEERDGRTVRLVEDASLAPGDAVATCSATVVDARLAAALDRARQALA